MFQDTKVFGSFSVNDLDEALKFYHDALGLKIQPILTGEGAKLLELHISGGSKFLVYSKPDHEPASFTILYFPVQDVAKAVEEMTLLGIKFEHYHNQEVQTDEKGIFRGGGPAKAWFKDPAGNVLSVTETDKTHPID
jgi:predicted enzyme related to lactoylglutathione lyase